MHIIVPYRAGADQPWRAEQLEQFLNYMHQYLKGVQGQIWVVEQLGNKPFNRGALLNVGFMMANPRRGDTIILHDVDLLPSSSLYMYYNYNGDSVHHIGRAFSRYDTDSYLGGVLSIPAKVFFEINGFPNDYWGWGGEDDELRERLKGHKIFRATKGTLVDMENMDASAKLAFLKAHDLKCKNKGQLRKKYMEARERGEYVHGLHEVKATIYSVEKRTHCHIYATLLNS